MSGKTWVTGPNIELSLLGLSSRQPAEELAGIIDTGASVICLDNRIARKLGLIASNRKRMQMADGREMESTGYAARMVIPALEFDDVVEVYGVEMEYPSNRVLIGRSFLKGYIVNYDGPMEQFQFHKTAPRLQEHLEDY